MCGIFAYSGPKNATQIVLKGLKKLDYRGYDSWGLAATVNQKIDLNKNTGLVVKANSANFPGSHSAIGHTRWASHGGITKKNAHPHLSSDKSFALAHNGIIENYQVLKDILSKQGKKFTTQTDTEVALKLIELYISKKQSLKKAVIKTFKKIRGRNALIVLSKKGDIIAVRNGSPLVIGFLKNKPEIYFSSDTLSFANQVKKILILDNNQLAHFNRQTSPQLNLINISTSASIKPKLETLDLTKGDTSLTGFKHYMIKEIHDSPDVISQVTNQAPKSYKKLAKAIKSAQKVYTIGSGTAGLAAAQTAYYLRVFGNINAISLIGAEAGDYYHLFNQNDLIIAPSQSGETADVLEVLELAKKKGVKIASYVNMAGSMMTRISDFPFMAYAGPEICVMSTKVFVSQIAWGYLVAKTVAGQHRFGSIRLEETAKTINNYLNNKKNHQALKTLSTTLTKAKDIFLLSKAQNLQIIKEGMVKIVEGSYCNAHAIPSGDLKHYAITIIEPGVPVIFVISNDSVKNDIINAVHEVKARGATTIGIGPSNQSQFDYFLKIPDIGETSAIISVIPLQLLAYYLTVQLGHNVDKPRNIAKSVTVK